MKKLLLELLRDHPTLVLTLSYLLVTLIGVDYSLSFYNQFGINIVKFADVSDFLLASILEPISIIIFFAVGAFTFVMFLLDFWLRKRLPGYGRWTANKMASRYTDPLIFVVAVSVFVGLYVSDYAKHNAEAVKAGESDEYIVRIADYNESREKTLALLGNSNRFTFLYDLAQAEVLIVPVENVSFLRKK